VWSTGERPDAVGGDDGGTTKGARTSGPPMSLLCPLYGEQPGQSSGALPQTLLVPFRTVVPVP